MPYIDPWRGTNEGLANLGNTFDELERRRQIAVRQDREDKDAALREPILRAQGDEATRRVTNLREFDAARKTQEA